MEVLLAIKEVEGMKNIYSVIQKLGYGLHIVKDKKSAIDVFQKAKINFILVDTDVAEIDGMNLCKDIRSGEEDYTYIALLSEKERGWFSEDVHDLIADAYMSKPINLQELLGIIKSAERIVNLEQKVNDAFSDIRDKNEELKNALNELKTTQTQILQSEKMSSIGQLAAGVAHEINNPTGFVSSNLKTLSEYFGDIFELIKEYRAIVSEFEDGKSGEAASKQVSLKIKGIIEREQELDVDFILEDIKDLIEDCKDGTERVKKIVINLKEFAHPGEDELQKKDINQGLESTLSVIWNELKYKADVIKDFGELPLVKCYPQQINQVFMNILINGSQAIEERGEIKIKTRADDNFVEIQISDTGIGIPKENIIKIFDPFFTTKEVGKGTGLGLNVSYKIIKNHNGSIEVESEEGKGTVFRIRIPIE